MWSRCRAVLKLLRDLLSRRESPNGTSASSEVDLLGALDGILIDGSLALYMHGLRNRMPQEVGILFDTAVIGRRSLVGREALNTALYSHNPEDSDTFWFHGVAEVQDLIYDSSKHGFCAGVKLVSLTQLRRFKQRRFAALGSRNDAMDAQAISRVLTKVGSDHHR